MCLKEIEKTNRQKDKEREVLYGYFKEKKIARGEKYGLLQKFPRVSKLKAPIFSLSNKQTHSLTHKHLYAKPQQPFSHSTRAYTLKPYF